MSIYRVKLIGEEGDIEPVINKHSIVIQTKWNGLKMMDHATFDLWNRLFIFPDNEKAEYFSENFKHDMNDFREGMMKDDYVFHIVNFKYPQKEELYADQMRMTKDYKY